MAAAAILKIHFNGHISGAIAPIYTKFSSERETEVLETEVPSNFTYLKSKMEAGRHFKNTLNGQGKARREAARRRNSECKINLSRPIRNCSRGSGSRPTAQR